MTMTDHDHGYRYRLTPEATPGERLRHWREWHGMSRTVLSELVAEAVALMSS